MDKNNFIALLHRYAGSSPQEAEEIFSLKSAYPYSQLLQTLSARVSKDHQLANQEHELQMAAVWSADRTVLKEIITYQPNGDRFVSSAPDEKSVQEVEIPKPVRSVDGVDYADEVMRDLDKLNTSRHNFEMLFVEYTEVDAKPKPEDAQVKHVKKEVVKEEIPTERSTKSKKERIIELAKSLNAGEHAQEIESIPGKKTHRTGDNKNNPSDSIIEEIRTSKREIKPESEKQKEQIEIINQFIKTQPSITSSKDRAISPSGDLNPIKSGEFGDNIVSETLVEILIKQGKKDKAIEVLKKLIWKYPQKKSYFAAQIEDLKK